jgi:phospholipid/cholesterol/gamma-HCH transport system substrate-binding protein
LPTLMSTIDDPPNSSGEPVYRELLYGTVGLSSASQNFDGNGPAVRYHAGGGDTVVTTGQVPSIGESLVGLTDEPILGSRPRWTGVRPPFRPDVPCISQEPPNLSAETGPAPEQHRISSFDPAPLDDAIDLLRVPRR